MDLQSKLIKALERTIDLQEGLIAEQEAEIQRLEAEKAAGQWYPIQDPYKSPQWPGVWPNDFDKVYGPVWRWDETTAPKYDVTFTTRTGDFDEVKREGSSS